MNAATNQTTTPATPETPRKDLIPMTVADMIGAEVDYEAGGERRHGTIRRATYSDLGAVLVIHPRCRPNEVAVDTLLVGREAAEVLAALEGSAA